MKNCKAIISILLISFLAEKKIQARSLRSRIESEAVMQSPATTPTVDFSKAPEICSTAIALAEQKQAIAETIQTLENAVSYLSKALSDTELERSLRAKENWLKKTMESLKMGDQDWVRCNYETTKLNMITTWHQSGMAILLNELSKKAGSLKKSEWEDLLKSSSRMLVSLIYAATEGVFPSDKEQVRKEDVEPLVQRAIKESSRELKIGADNPLIKKAEQEAKEKDQAMAKASQELKMAKIETVSSKLETQKIREELLAAQKTLESLKSKEQTLAQDCVKLEGSLKEEKVKTVQAYVQMAKLKQQLEEQQKELSKKQQTLELAEDRLKKIAIEAKALDEKLSSTSLEKTENKVAFEVLKRQKAKADELIAKQSELIKKLSDQISSIGEKAASAEIQMLAKEAQLSNNTLAVDAAQLKINQTINPATPPAAPEVKTTAPAAPKAVTPEKLAQAAPKPVTPVKSLFG